GGTTGGGEDLDQRDEAAGLGDEGQESGDRGGGALIHVAGVDVQRDGGDLEGKTSNEHDNGEHDPRLHGHVRRRISLRLGHHAIGGGGRVEGGGDLVELDRAGRAVEVAEAEKHHRGGHGPEEEVLHPRLLRHRLGAGDGDHDVG